LTLAALPLVSFQSAGAQLPCAPASRAVSTGAQRSEAPAILQRRITLRARNIPLRSALDRIAAAARIRISYSAEAIPLDRIVCLDYESESLRQVFSQLLGESVRPVAVGADQIALTPSAPNVSPATHEAAAPAPNVSQLDRVIVTGSTDEAVRHSSPIALEVISGEQIVRRGSRTLSGSLDGIVPGLWLWEQSPLSMLSGYGSIRGSSSFGVSYPKVYVDGVEVANSLLVSHLDPDAVARIEVIRGPQGAALYGADAISGVMNIVTRHEGTEQGAPGLQVRTQGGASASDYSASQVFAQSHAATFRHGEGARSARLGLTATRIGAFVPDAFSQQLSASGSLRYVRPRGIVTGTFRLFAQDARNPSGLVLTAGESSFAHPGSAPIDSSRSQAVRQYTLGVNASFTPGERWTHSAVAGIDGYTLRSALSTAGVFPSAIDSALADATGSAVRASLRASSVGSFGDRARASATLTMTAEHSVVRDVATSSGSSLSSAALQMVESRSNTGVVGQVAAAFNDAVFLTAGIRVERNSALNVIGEFATLPMLGAAAVRSFGPATIKLRSAYGKGIRPVQSRSRAGTISSLRGSLPGSTLAPEEQSGTEFGADAFLGDRIGLHVTRFNQRASGLVQPVSVIARVFSGDGQGTTQLAYQLQNVGEIANSGWELKASLREGPWSGAATFSQVSSTVEKLGKHYTGDLQPGDRMLEVPAQTFGITSAFVQPRWFASWTVSRASNWINYDRLALLKAFTATPLGEAPYGPELRSFWRTYDGVTRAAARLEVDIRRGMTFTVDAENLLDEQRGEPDNITVLPGRTISAGLRVSF